jgi:MGT family glycosyltransferase
MSSICIIGHPASGHINPTLPVAEELRRRGHRVYYYATEPFRAKVEQTGSRFRSYGPQELFERNLSRGGLLGGMAGLIATTESILPMLIRAVSLDKPDFLLVEAHAVWGNLLAQILDLPATALCSMFAIDDCLISPAGLLTHLYGKAPREAAFEGLLGLSRYFDTARRLRARYDANCPGIVNYLGNRQPLNIVFTSREFQIGADMLDASYRFVGPSLSEGAVDFSADLAGDDPLIYISLGTMYNDEAGFYRDCISAFGNRPFRVVMAVGQRLDPGKLPPAPVNFRMLPHVPQVAVLRQADLFITHGGINSAHEAMWHGVPMIVFPQTADHYVVAGQVELAGAGVVLDRVRATPEALARLAELVLGDERFSTASARMGESLRAAGGAVFAVDQILAFQARSEVLKECC